MTGKVVAVIGGGQGCEHEVSLASAAAVAKGLRAAGYRVVPLTIGRDGTWLTDQGVLDEASRSIGLDRAVRLMQRCDVVFPAVHGPGGEDGWLAALCELSGVAYVGSAPAAGAMGMDKWVTKLVAGAHGISTAPGELVDRADWNAWTGPVVVKPVAAGSSVGVSLVEDPWALRPALELALSLGGRALVESVIPGREIDIAVLRRADGSLMVAPALEIKRDKIFDYETKYGGGADFRVPAEIPESAAEVLSQAALTMYEALDCSGVARVDFFLTPAGPVLNEINTMPGLTEHSQVPRMFAAAGWTYPQLLEELVIGATSPPTRPVPSPKS